MIEQQNLSLTSILAVEAAPVDRAPVTTIDDSKSGIWASKTNSAEKLAAFLDHSEIPHGKEQDFNGSARFILETVDDNNIATSFCPNAEKHNSDSGPSTEAVFVSKDGVFGFECSHSKCKEVHWSHFRAYHELQNELEAREVFFREKVYEDKPNPAPFQPQSLSHFMERSFPLPEPLIDGVLYKRDFVSLTGRRRHGKTTLLHNLALSGALGEKSYLGLNIVRPFKTVAFYLEDDAADMQDKLRTMLKGRSAPESFHLYTRQDFNAWRVPIDLTQATFKDRIIECCEAVSPDWITIDNLGVLIGADYNNSKVIHSVVEFVWELISRFGCAVTVAAHPRKQSNDVMETITLAKNPQRFFEECMGSSHFINSTGAMWGVERNEEDRTHLVLGSQRITGDHTITVAEKDDFGWLQLAQDDQVAWASLLNTNKRKEAWKAMPAVFTFTTAFLAQTGLTKKPFSNWWGELKRVGLIVPIKGSKTGEFEKADRLPSEEEMEPIKKPNKGVPLPPESDALSPELAAAVEKAQRECEKSA